MSDTEERSSKYKHRPSKHSHDSQRRKDKDLDRSKEHHSKKRSSHRRDGSEDDDGERRHKKHKHGRKDKRRERDERDESNGLAIVEDNDDAVWVEKDVGQSGEHPLATDIPTAESLNITSHATEQTTASLPPALSTESKLQRDEWMLLPEAEPIVPDVGSSKRARMLESVNEGLTEDYGEPQANKRGLGGEIDFFSSLGQERQKKPKVEKPDPEKLRVSRLELNVQLKEGKSLDEYAAAPAPKAVTPGGPGSQWRMQKLKRTYETAEEEGRPLEEVVLERYGTLEAFEEAREERRYLDERAERRANRSAKDGGGRHRERDDGSTTQPKERFIFNDISAAGDSRGSSRASSFRKPGAQDSGPSTPQLGGTFTPSYPNAPPGNKRLDALRGDPAGRQGSRDGSPYQSKPGTPIPSALTPAIPGRKRALSPSSLNKLQASVLRAKLMGQPNADELEKQYEEELQRAQSGGADESGVRVEVVPTLDGHGRMYDIGTGKVDPSASNRPLPGNRKKKEVVETRDPKTGEIARYNADDDTTTLGDLLRQEKFGAGMADQKNLDVELAGAIMHDGKFENDLEYMDDNAEKLGRKKMRTDAMKRQFAINDYARTQKALASCQFCYGEDDSPPKAGVISMGTRVYLSCTLFEELVEGHCYIVPIQHHLSMLEADDDVWEEVKNFMKCLMRMFHEEEKGVIFYETVLNLKWQKHTMIECVPVPLDLFQDLPAYFKESILASEAEWSQHKKLIDFSARPGGFRRAMVPNLPYFMVQWDYKGEKGYGHVIEGTGESAGLGDDTGGAVDEGDKGGGDFPRYFAAEIIGNQLDVEPRKWRRPRRMDLRANKERVAKFNKKYAKYDWTHLIEKS
ncbi:hypothetical protein FRB99_006615 [Tulasnella sp. 403]|nr:hypothetical protein FRB99_006615 [Tulasnella sp. 403]